MEKVTTKIRAILGSSIFYWITIAVFVIEASWIAVSARYPMAFDENYHFGLIQLYSHQLGPFIRHQPAGANIFGDVTRYPSYLYHYLMSFPYRLIAHFTKNFGDQVVLLRLINVTLFTTGLALWRKVFRTSGASNALASVALAVFILIPQIPFLAAQNNYDNLLFPLLSLSVLLAINFSRKLSEEQLFDTPLLLALLAICLLTSLVQYMFLPIFFGLVIFLAATIIRQKSQIKSSAKQSWQTLKTSTKVVLVTGLLIAIGLFGERYGYNIVRYHELVPDCGQVVGVTSCLDYSPWARNYSFELSRSIDFRPTTLKYTGVWAYSMSQQLFFVLRQDYVISGVFRLIDVVVMVVAVTGILFILWQLPKLWRGDRLFRLATTVFVTYLIALWLLDYSEYRHFQHYVAIQGRYLIPLLPLFFYLLASSYREILRAAPSWVKPTAAAILLLLLLQGGGGLTWLLKSNPSWWWPNQKIIELNHAAQKIFRPLVIP